MKATVPWLHFPENVFEIKILACVWDKWTTNDDKDIVKRVDIKTEMKREKNRF